MNTNRRMWNTCHIPTLVQDLSSDLSAFYKERGDDV